MQSFLDLDRTLAGQPIRLGARLARLDVGRGRETLYADQLPQLLQALANESRVESITASSAIEGVFVAPDRVDGLARPGDGPRRYRNRSEREFAGYRDAIDEIMRADSLEDISVPYILHLHRKLFGHTDERGGRLKTEENLIASFANGYRETLFTPPPPAKTEFMLRELVERYRVAVRDQAAHPVLLTAALILDFLAIHPTADGNGRVARLLTTHALLQHGYGVARYASIEQRIYESKHAYYDALYQSQRGWHEAAHSVWPWTEYLVGVLADAYDDFEARLAERRGLGSLSKQQRVREYVLRHAAPVFRLRDIRAALPGVSDQTIRIVLAELRDEGSIRVDEVAGGSGPHAAWRRVAPV